MSESSDNTPILLPDPFLVVRVVDLESQPTLRVACVGYEGGQWRAARFASHLMEWLPDYALDPVEARTLNSGNAVSLLRRAAYNVYTSAKYQRRGEFGEVLLHLLLRQECRTIPAISKVYFKTAANDTVKGFDAVHVVGPPHDLELWLGEAKFYNDRAAAIRDALAELDEHLQADYLRGEFLSITSKINAAHPHADALKQLMNPNTTLDAVFSRLCIPVLMTYDSDCVSRHDTLCDEYLRDFENEGRDGYAAIVDKLQERSMPTDLRLHILLVPLRCKRQLVELMDRELKRWQPAN